MAEKLVANRLDDIIKLLEDVRTKVGGHVPVQINIVNQDMRALQSICLDNDMGDKESILYLEVDTEDEAPYKENFTFYTQGEELYNEDGSLNIEDVPF